MTPTFASKWLIPRLADLTAAHPDIDLRILATESLSSFHADGIDLAVRQGTPPFGANLEAAVLFRQQVVAVCAPSLVAGAGTPLAPEDLAGFNLLHDTHNQWPEFLETIYGSRKAPVLKGMHFNQTALSIDAAIAGQGIALANRFLVSRELATGQLTQPLEGVLGGNRDFHLLARRPSSRSEAAEAVRLWLSAACTE